MSLLLSLERGPEMKLPIRIFLYVVLLVLASVFLGRFRTAYNASKPTDRMGEQVVQETAAVPAAEVSPTNGVVESTNVVGSATNTVVPTKPADAKAPPSVPSAPKQANSVGYLAGFVLTLLGLGGLVAWDVANLLGSRAGRAVMADDYIEKKDPEYDQAEEAWAQGNHLEAISMMRNYLKKNPSEQHAAIRIAEIYEKDLGNYLAAALELEEVLKQKLQKEKWGWTAIHLANLYSGKLNKADKAMEILNRVVNEYSDTGAAKKARQRLGIPEPDKEVEQTAAAESEPSTPPAADPNAHLPKGFRVKK